MDLRKYSVGVYLCVCIRELHFAIALVARDAVHTHTSVYISNVHMCVCVCVCGCVVVWVCIEANKNGRLMGLVS